MEKKTTKKSDHVCPVCGEKVLPPNEWVRFHIRYEPPLVVLACSYCNFAEYIFRTLRQKHLKLNEVLTPERYKRMQTFMRLFLDCGLVRTPTREIVEKERKAVKDEIRSKIGNLCQFLNELHPDSLVTNSVIEKWLGLAAPL